MTHLRFNSRIHYRQSLCELRWKRLMFLHSKVMNLARILHFLSVILNLLNYLGGQTSFKNFSLA